MLSLAGVVGLLVVVCPVCGLRGSGRCCAGTRATVSLARSLGVPVWPVFVAGGGDGRGVSADASVYRWAMASSQAGAGASAPARRDRKPGIRQPAQSEALADALQSTGLSLEADQVLRERWDDGLHGAVDRLVYDPVSGEDRFVRGEDGMPVFSDQLYEDVEIREADYSVKQLNWRQLPEWELREQLVMEDTHLLDAPRAGYASAARGRDLGAKVVEAPVAAWSVDAQHREERLEALAVRQLEYSLRLAFGGERQQPLSPFSSAVPQARGHVRLGTPAAA